MQGPQVGVSHNRVSLQERIHMPRNNLLLVPEVFLQDCDGCLVIGSSEC